MRMLSKRMEVFTVLTSCPFEEPSTLIQDGAGSTFGANCQSKFRGEAPALPRGMRLSGLPLSTRREKVRFPALVRTKHGLESCQIHDLSGILRTDSSFSE
ncbi:MAG: hypothetical protein JWQ49_6105 [Edaphobacter sp.]|nr:hypothetical protein [Edaphobacter sp.]